MAIFDSLRKIFSPGSPGAGDDVAAKRAGKRPQGGGAFGPGGAGYEFLRGFAPAPVSRYEEAQRQREEAARQEEIDQRRARADDLSIRSTETKLSNEEADRRRAAGLRGAIAAQAGGGDFVENIAAIAEQYPDLYTPEELEVARIGGGKALQAFLKDPPKPSASGVPAGIQEAAYWQSLLDSDDPRTRNAAEFALGVRARPVAGGRTVDIGGVPHAWSDAVGGYVPQSTLGLETSGRGAIERAEKRGAELGKAEGKGDAILTPGTPEYIAKQNERAMAQQKSRQVNEALDMILEESSTLNIGPLAQFNPLATDLDALLSELEANIGFETLNSMRRASPTGGALGQVSERELSYLQQTLGSLKRSQSLEQFQRNVGRVRKRIQEVVDGTSPYSEADSDLSESSDDELLSILGGG